MDFRAERALYLGRGAGKRNPVASVRRLNHGEALRFQPGRDLPDVGLAEAEAVGVLLGGDPLMVVRRFPVLLLRHQLRNRLLLGRGRHGQQRHGSQLHGRIDRPLVVLRQRLVAHVASQSNRLAAGEDSGIESNGRAGDAVADGGKTLAGE